VKGRLRVVLKAVPHAGTARFFFISVPLLRTVYYAD
jgi:hypothetical protein